MKLSNPFKAGLVAAGLTLVPLAAQAAPGESGEPMVERGRYLVQLGGCNDCHTPGYAASGGKVPESQWLVGDQLGWRGEWGTTYPRNLRLLLNAMSEDDWVQWARTLKTRPPMPWFNVNAMSEQDQRALYRFVRSLGPAGVPAPAFVPPDQEPSGPVIAFPMPPRQLAHQ